MLNRLAPKIESAKHCARGWHARKPPTWMACPHTTHYRGPHTKDCVRACPGAAPHVARTGPIARHEMPARTPSTHAQAPGGVVCVRAAATSPAVAAGTRTDERIHEVNDQKHASRARAVHCMKHVQPAWAISHVCVALAVSRGRRLVWASWGSNVTEPKTIHSCHRVTARARCPVFWPACS